jgi:putative ABC transport system permease protein
MNLVATLRVALLALRINKMRSALTMLGIIIGVAAVIVMIAVGNGAQARVEEQIKSLGSNIIMVLSGSVTSGGARGGSGSQPTIYEEDATAMMREIDDIQAAAPTLRGSGQVIAGNANWSTVFYGITPEYLEVREWPIVEGRSFEPAEMNGSGKVVLIGQTVAENLFGTASPLDQVIRVKKVPLTVIGVLQRKGQSMMGQDQDDTLLMPINTARTRVIGVAQAKSRSVSSIMVKVKDGADMTQAEANMKDLRAQPVRNSASTRSLVKSHGAAAGCRGLRFTLGRRHWHHEYHAGFSHRAHTRNRLAHGGRCAQS